MKNLPSILFLLALLLAACNDVDTTEKVTASTTETTENMTTVKNKPTFIHTVFFWLKSDLTEAQRQQFLKDVNTLADIEEIRSFYVGKPAQTPRDVVDNSYDYALILHFDNADAQDAYQIHAIHEKFVEAQLESWDKVVVYDTLIE